MKTFVLEYGNLHLPIKHIIPVHKINQRRNKPIILVVRQDDVELALVDCRRLLLRESRRSVSDHLTGEDVAFMDLTDGGEDVRNELVIGSTA